MPACFNNVSYGNVAKDNDIIYWPPEEDMSFILQNYFMANMDRDIHSEVYDWNDFQEYVAGAY